MMTMNSDNMSNADNLANAVGEELDCNNINNPWMMTYPSRRVVSLKDPRASDIDIEDICHALSMQCRFGGHCSDFYSVAQHSVHVAQLVQAIIRDEGYNFDDDRTLEAMRLGLMHDAHEAYIGDMIRPMKSAVGNRYHLLEGKFMACVQQRFGLYGEDEELVGIVKQADVEMLALEAKLLQGINPARDWGLDVANSRLPVEFRIMVESVPDGTIGNGQPGADGMRRGPVIWSPDQARLNFLGLYTHLDILRILPKTTC